MSNAKIAEELTIRPGHGQDPRGSPIHQASTPGTASRLVINPPYQSGLNHGDPVTPHTPVPSESRSQDPDQPEEARRSSSSSAWARQHPP